MAMVVFIVEYIVSTGGSATTGVLRVEPVADEPLCLLHVCEQFPFEGKFHFRAKVQPRGRPFVWLDLREPQERVPLVEKNVAVVKATPMFDLEGLENPHPGEDKEQEDLAVWRKRQDEAAARRREALRADDLFQMARDLKQQDEEVRAADAANRPAVFDWSNVRSAMAQVQSSSTSAARSFGRFLRRAAEAATSAASGFLEGGALLSDRARTALETLRSELTTQPRWDHQVSREYLERLWNFAFGNAAVAQESERWQTLGFVTRDPTADMEESGLLGLKSFVYGAERYPDAVRRMLEEHKTGEDDRLLVGLTAFLLARVLAELIALHQREQLGSTRRVYYKLFEDPDAFYELHALALVYLGTLWRTKRLRQAHLAQALSNVEQKVTEWLSTGPASADQLHRYVVEKEGIRV